jgi:hypothetical protein
MVGEIAFKAKFEKMLAGRKPTLWIKPLGLSNGTISRISSNVAPGSDILTVMQRAENVNINWLLGSDHRPFMIDTHIDHTSFIDYLNYHSEDCDYQLDYLLSENLNTLVVVFSQPASMQFKDKTIGYKHLEVLAGPLNPATLQTLSALKERHAHSHEFVLSDIQTRQLTRGEFGTYLLFGDAEKTGLIPSGIQKTSNTKITELAGSYKESKNKEVKFKDNELTHIGFLDEIHNVLSNNHITLLPSEINAIAKVLAAIGFDGTADLTQIKSAAQLANVQISEN